ncbi:MAG: diguanylate cyclase domain-containing protein [Desulfovibrionales bacterium]
MLTDITERKKAEQTIQYMAYHDNLTGLPNRLLFNDRLQQEMARCRRNNDILAIMVLDLDQFKAINDTLGHHAGDVLLKSISLRLQNTIRECDTVARMGGDEFLIVLSKLASRSRAMDVGKRILQAVSAPLDIEDTQVAINVSIGIAFFPVDGDDADTLIKTADKAMYRAKEQNRRNNVSNIHTSEMN